MKNTKRALSVPGQLTWNNRSELLNELSFEIEAKILGGFVTLGGFDSTATSAFLPWFAYRCWRLSYDNLLPAIFSAMAFSYRHLIGANLAVQLILLC